MANIVEKVGPYGNSIDPSNWKLEFGPQDNIQAVKVCYGPILYAIEFVIAAGQAERTSIRRFGGDTKLGKFEEREIKFEQGEHITIVSGKHGLYETSTQVGQLIVASINFHTNLRPSGYGLFGETTNCTKIENFSISLPSSPSGLVGFYGRSNTYLESFGAYIKRTILKLGPWGGPYPPNWNMELGPYDTIKRINIRSGWIVDGIEFFIAGHDGRTTTKRFGGRGGHSNEIILSPDEHITNISGKYAMYNTTRCCSVASITIHTNERPEGYGPFGEATDCSDIKEFSSSIPTDSVATGFFGRFSTYVLCIGVYSKSVR